MKKLKQIQDPIKRALYIAENYGQGDGAHHKAWAIDQMVRALLNCPLEEVEYKLPSSSDPNRVYSATKQGESKEYIEFIKEYEQDGVYTWEKGIS